MVHAICLTAIKWLSKVISIMAAFVYYYWAQLDDSGASVHLFGKNQVLALWSLFSLCQRAYIYKAL